MALIAALSGAASKYVLHELPAGSLMFLRFMIAFITMLTFYALLQWKSTKQILTLLLVSSGMGLSSVFYIYGIRTTNLGASQAIFMTLPIITLILSYFILQQKIKLKKIFGIVISMIGAGIIFFLPKIYSGTEVNVWDIRGNIFILLGAASYASYLVFAKKTKFTPMEFMYGWVVSAAIIWVFLGINDMLTLDHPYKDLTILGWFLIVGIGAIGTVGLYFLVQKLMKISDPLFTSFGNYVQLIFSTLLGVFMFSEDIGIGFLIGSILTMYGVYYINKQK